MKVILLALASGAIVVDSSHFLRERAQGDATVKGTIILEEENEEHPHRNAIKKEDESYWNRLMQETDMSGVALPTTTALPEPTPADPKATGCIDSGGTVSTANCCIDAGDFPNTCVIGACGCSPEFSEETLVCECPDGLCFDGTACVSSLEAMCVSAGGTVSTDMCCKSVDDFPNTCLIGACGCAPDDSHEVKVCECPDDLCWDGSDCVSNDEAAAGCVDSGGTVSTANCCVDAGDFPNTCVIGACGCSPEFSEETLVCECPDGLCFDGNACVSSVEATCVSAGGTVTTGTCCKSVDDFPNTCLIGACGCAPDDSHEVKVCECPDDLCWDGSDCVSFP